MKIRKSKLQLYVDNERRPLSELENYFSPGYIRSLKFGKRELIKLEFTLININTNNLDLVRIERSKETL